MAKIDITDEAVMDGSPMAVYTAFLNELFGFTNWWMPHIRFSHVGSIARALFFRLIAPFVDTAKAHSEVMQLGFKACNDYLAQKGWKEVIAWQG